MAGIIKLGPTALTALEILKAQRAILNYADLATWTTPISVPADTWVPLTNDATHPHTRTQFPAFEDVDLLWDVENSQFDFTQWPLGTTFQGRFDIQVTTTNVYQNVDFKAILGLGSPIQFDFPLTSSQLYKEVGSYSLTAATLMDLPHPYVQLYPTKLYVRSDSDATVSVRAFYITGQLPINNGHYTGG